MTAKRILVVAHSALRGGAEYCLDTTLRHLDRDRFEPIVVFPHDGPMVEATRELGIAVELVPLCHWMCFGWSAWYLKHLTCDLLPNVARLRKLIQERSIDLVYTNTAAIFEAALAARSLRVPHLWHIHEVMSSGIGLNPSLPMSWIRRFIRKNSTLVLFESNSAREAFEAGTLVRHADVIHNSVRLRTDSTIDHELARRHFKIEPGEVVIAFIGQFIDRKNPLLLIESLKLAKQKNLLCIIAGEGPLSAAIDREVVAAGMQSMVRRIPFQHDVLPLLKAMDILVLPSREESFGLVLAEAGACGKPVIACRSQGPNEIVVDGKTGILVSQNSAAEMATAIDGLVGNSELCAMMGRAAQQRVSSHFNANLNTLRLEYVIDTIINSRATSTNRNQNRKRVDAA